MVTVKENGYPIYECAFCGNEVSRRSQGKTKNVKLHFCNNECKANYQKLARPVTKDWLYEHYITMGEDCPTIGKQVDRDAKSVWNWLKDWGIPTRKRGTTNNGPNGRPPGFHLSQETRDKIRKIAIAQGRVPWKKENGPPMKGKHGAETSNWKGGITPERQSFCNSDEWKEAVKAVWKRDNAICRRCGKHHNETQNRGTFHIHHIVSFKNKELRANVDNLVLLCDDCHHWVHSNGNVNRDFIKEE